MTVEELLFKMGIDSSKLDAGLRKAKVQLAGFKEESEKTFLHAGSAARGFHKLLDQLNDTIPGLGNALKLAISPAVGIMAAASAAAAFLGEKLKEINAELDRQATENLKPIGDAWQEQHDLSKTVNEAIAEQNHWLREQKELHNDVLAKMKEELSHAKESHEIDQKRTLTKREHADLDVTSAQKQKEIIQASRDQLQKDLQAARLAEGKAASAFIESPEQNTAILAGSRTAATKSQLEAATTRMNALKVAQAKTPAETDQFRLLPNWQEIKDAAARFVGQKGLAESLEDAQAEVKRLTTQHRENVSAEEKAKETLKELRTSLEETRATVNKLDSAFTSTTETLAAAERDLTKALFEQQQTRALSRYAPSMQELAASGGPFGNLARQIQGGKQEITGRLARGDYAGAERARKALEGYDVTEFITPQQAAGEKFMEGVGDPMAKWDATNAKKQSDFEHRGLVERTRHVSGLQDKMTAADQMLQKLGNVFSGAAIRVVGADQ